MPTQPLVFHTSPEHTIAWRDGAPVSVRRFLADVAHVATALPAGGHVFNVCRDRYRFAVGLGATLVAGRISLLPSTHTPETVRQLRSFAPDAFCLHDWPDCAIDLPQLRYPEPDRANDLDEAADAPFAVPRIDTTQTMAWVFTSGSTGAPVPHRKSWGALVDCTRTAAARLGLLDGRAYTLVGTVPAQHMYGFESTVLLALLGGFAFSNRQPFYPGDIRAELEAAPQPRVLVSSPIHLRSLLSAQQPLPRVALALSATAPLAQTLAREAEARFGAPLLEIYGSTETGQIATRRTAQDRAWRLFPRVRLELRAAVAGRDSDSDSDNNGDDDGGGEPTVWVHGGHVETPVPMGDTLELLNDGRFLLHGRKADLVNIAGKRTSLAWLNHQLGQIPGVVDGVFFMPDAAPAVREALAGTVVRLAALVVAPTLAPVDLQRALRERIDPAFMPRPLVFVDALPRNEAGKLPRAALVALMALAARSGRGTAQNDGAAPRAPTHPADRPDASAPAASARALSFEIPAHHPALPGHFPGHPVVPGVVLLDRAIDAIGAALNRPLHTWRLSTAKFPSSASPGETLDLAFDETASGAIRFTVHAGPREVASGTLSLQPDGAQS